MNLALQPYTKIVVSRFIARIWVGAASTSRVGLSSGGGGGKGDEAHKCFNARVPSWIIVVLKVLKLNTR